jgi:hypothetical protein
MLPRQQQELAYIQHQPPPNVTLTILAQSQLPPQIHQQPQKYSNLVMLTGRPGRFRPRPADPARPK